MKKSFVFLSVFIIGGALVILELAVLQYDGAAGFLLTLAGVFMVIGGAVGACYYSKKARAVFSSFVEVLFGWL